MNRLIDALDAGNVVEARKLFKVDMNERIATRIEDLKANIFEEKDEDDSDDDDDDESDDDESDDDDESKKKLDEAIRKRHRK